MAPCFEIAGARWGASGVVEGIDHQVGPLYDVYVANMGPRYAEMIEAYGKEVLPELRSRHVRA